MREKNLVTKLKNGHFDKTQKLKLFPNSRSQILTKLKNRICDKTDKSNLDKTQIVRKLKNSNCEKTIKKKTNWDKTKTLNWQQTSKTQVETKLKKSYCEKPKSQSVTKLKQQLNP